MIFVFYKKDGVLRRIIIFPTIKTPEKGVTLVTLVTQGGNGRDLFGGRSKIENRIEIEFLGLSRSLGSLGRENGEKSRVL